MNQHWSPGTVGPQWQLRLGMDKSSGAIGERADWRRDDEFVYAAGRRALEHRSCRGLGASDIAGYPSRVLPEPDVDKRRLSLCRESEDRRQIEVKEVP